MPKTLPTMPARPFSEAWPMEASEAWVAAHAQRPDFEKDHAAFNTWRDTQFEPLYQRLEDAALEHLRWLSHQGRLVPPLHAEALKTNWLTGWSALIETPDTEKAYLLSAVSQRLTSSLMLGLRHDQESAVATHAHLQERMASGNFDWYDNDDGAGECFNTGERLRLKFENWVPTLGLFNFKGPRESRFLPLVAGQFALPTFQHCTIEVPSGELWINDWHRTAAFNAATREASDGSGSINSEKGCVARTQAYADLGFASVFVGNSMPRVVVEQGRVLIGRLYDEQDHDEGEPLPVRGLPTPSQKESRQELGSVCTDLWWATLIDKQVMTRLMSQHATADEVAAQVKELEEEYGHTVMKVQVPPGTYHLYFAGSPQTFGQTFNSEEVGFEGFDEPMCVLSPTELTPKAVLSAQRKPKA